MNTPFADMVADLRNHLLLCRELLTLVERERQALRQSETPALAGLFQAKKNLLPSLTQSLDQLRTHRVNWQKLSPEERSQHPEVGALLRQDQDLILKIIIFDRENEQALLRRGLFSARDLPPSDRQRPQVVSALYRRQAAQ